MSNKTITLDISTLPEERKQELLDFYEFLRLKYELKTESLRFQFILDNPLEVKHIMLPNREDLYER